MLDGGYLLHSQLSSVKRFPNYGKIAKTILRSAMKHPSLEIHVLLDTYQPDSLKTCEGGRRGNSDQAYIISGPEQKTFPINKITVENSDFKQQFGRFLQQEWQQEEYREFTGGKKLHVSHAEGYA